VKSCAEEKSKTTALCGWGVGGEKQSMTISCMVILAIRNSKFFNTAE